MKAIDINVKEKSYKISIKKGILSSIGERLKTTYQSRNIVVITDTNVEKFYMETLKNSLLESGFTMKIISIEPGEKSKNLATLERVYEKLCEFQIRRKDIIISLGGGVVGDLSGFAASTYLRGINYIQVPTSLLAQVDSSIGGKVAVDLPWGKNLVGSFYHPDAVFIDPDVLLSLNDKFFSDGMGEVIKYGFIKDKSILNLLDSCKDKDEVLQYIEDIIYKCCSIKKHLVEKDERDLGERMMLNFGHTLAHGIEKYYNYGKYSHGEAVAIGMTYMTNITERMDITKKGTHDYMKGILTKYGLPVNMPDMDKQALVNSIALDKKSSGDRINIIVIEEAGICKIMKIKLREVYGFLFPEDII
ncbi:3-dehydroquinate synthase [Clostridium kluyveri]|uniref:3-dehydroquinate synthase n=1 Tax=Clostridium kluyveri (strain ATCC 8527 / DSM 555 / NBRC 12016 / NCIMB 10680 / K1) TaxID=431943 RepID=AROB_CLOK5|nr:3-dehydroquinate synthase [Clostridium kluyveri]A5N6A8.1 RecName: Full=3-dehydroquinate synthase; Short=DHQS [Clostridium kluyveri DSM 555]EDK32839.1 AroB [Clostridium kluyveri DSM 555]